MLHLLPENPGLSKASSFFLFFFNTPEVGHNVALYASPYATKLPISCLSSSVNLIFLSSLSAWNDVWHEPRIRLLPAIWWLVCRHGVTIAVAWAWSVRNQSISPSLRPPPLFPVFCNHSLSLPSVKRVSHFPLPFVVRVGLFVEPTAPCLASWAWPGLWQNFPLSSLWDHFFPLLLLITRPCWTTSSCHETLLDHILLSQDPVGPYPLVTRVWLGLSDHFLLYKSLTWFVGPCPLSREFDLVCWTMSSCHESLTWFVWLFSLLLVTRVWPGLLDPILLSRDFDHVLCRESLICLLDHVLCRESLTWLVGPFPLALVMRGWSAVWDHFLSPREFDPVLVDWAQSTN